MNDESHVRIRAKLQILKCEDTGGMYSRGLLLFCDPAALRAAAWEEAAGRVRAAQHTASLASVIGPRTL